MKTLTRIVLLSLALVALLLLAQGAGQLWADPDSTAGVPDTQAQSAAGLGLKGGAVNTANVSQGAAQISPSAVPIGSQQSDQEFAALKAAAQTGSAPVQSSDFKFQNDRPAGGSAPAAPALGTNFLGSVATGWFPPDPTLAVGPSEVVIAVNESWTIFDKAGGNLFSSTLQNWFSNVLPNASSGFSVFDPHLVYDRLGGRFILIAGALRKSDKQSFIVISVSNTNSAIGGWCNWATPFRLNGSTNTSNWADYPQIGVTNNALFLTANMFAFGGGFQYVKMRILDKSVFYNTSCPGYSWWDYWSLTNKDGTKTFTLTPALTMDGATSEFLVSSQSSGSKLFLVRVNNPLLATRSLTKFSVNVGSYAIPPNAQQPGSPFLLNTGDTRMQNAEEINGWLWTAHSTACRWSGEAVNRSCLRWYQLNLGSMTVAQQATWGAPQLYYFYPAIMANDVQDAAIVFSRSGANEFGSTRYTARNNFDYVNSLQGSNTLQNGLSTYVQIDPAGRDRWGDYGGIGLDPSNQCFWMHHEFASDATNVWNTWVGETCTSRLGAPAP